MNTPIRDFVKNYAESDSVRLHMPGHKGIGTICKYDITEIDGADSLYDAVGIIKESEKIKYHSENGQDYFDNWLKNARSIVKENGIENIRSEYPNIALAVEICGAE